MKVDIVFLLHAQYGTLKDFEVFARRVKRSTRSIKCELRIIMLLKGFSKSKHIRSEQADNIVFAPNVGRDLYSYIFYTKISTADFIFYFNTSSKLISDHFFRSGLNILLSEKCGAVSATGSYAGLVNPHYFIELASCNRISPIKAFTKFLITFVQKIGLSFMGYNSIPHLRTNAFGCSKQFICDAKKYFGNELKTRLQSLMFESGDRGLSGYATKMGFGLYVIDKNGTSYKMENWLESCTYAVSDQTNLAVKDNRTDEYCNASSTERLKLYVATWMESPSYIRPI